MKLSVVLFCTLVACAVGYTVEHRPVAGALPPSDIGSLGTAQPRDKRSLLLGAGTAGLLGAGLAAGAVGLGAGIIGAKAGIVGGALAASALNGRSYGGYYGGHGYGGYAPVYSGYGGYGHGYGGYAPVYGGYGHGGYYRSYYPSPSYVVSDSWC